MTAPASSDTSRLRLTVLIITVGCLFAALVARLWFLQVVSASAGAQQVNATGVVTVYTQAARGEILDRKGRVLVDNRNVPVIEVQRQDVSDTAMVRRLAALLGMAVKSLTGAIDNSQYNAYEPVPVFEGATPSQILYVQEHSSLFPGVTATTISQPHVTPLGEYAGALLGYVGAIPASQLTSYEKHGYQVGDLVGIGGVEQQFEKQLRGKPGVERIQVDASGRYLGVLSSSPPVPGHNLRLSIDGEVQKQAMMAMMQGQAVARSTLDTVTKRNFTSPGGSVVVEDPRSGQLLALATDPTYDPNLFNNGGISQANYKELNPCAGIADQATANACALAHPADALENRPIQGEYAPGSTFKLVTATAGLRYGVVTPASPYDDIGYIRLCSTSIPSCTLKDDAGGAGVIDLPTAITVSSDAYFYNIGVNLWERRQQVGRTALQKVADGYGLGKPTGVDLPAESSGVIPTPALYAYQKKHFPNAFATGTWYSGDSAHTAIGQGEVLVTPLQLANAYAAFANGGTIYRPQVALDAETATGRVVRRYHPVASGHTPALSPSERASMVDGFRGVVSSSGGTAFGAFNGTNVAGEDIAGKTGTAQVTAPKQDTSVFTSFAPASAPRYVVTCLMEDSGYGASIAAPIVREVYQKLFNKPVQPVRSTQAHGNAF